MSDGGAQPAGWYHAQGDPPNTQRYWDGAQWQGGPQPIASSAVAYGPTGSGSAAAPGARFVAFVIDSGILVAGYILIFIIAAIGSAFSETLAGVIVIFGLLGVVAFSLYNQIWLLGTTGQSIGKKQQGITVLRSDTGQPIGAFMAFIRPILQGVFAIPFYLDHWWILVDSGNRRLSDKVLGFHVYNA